LYKHHHYTKFKIELKVKVKDKKCVHLYTDLPKQETSTKILNKNPKTFFKFLYIRMLDEEKSEEEPHTRVKNIIKNKLINCFMVTEVFSMKKKIQ